MPCKRATLEQVSPDFTMYMMRPSGPGVEVRNPCKGGAALAELPGKITPTIRISITIKLTNNAVRIFIGGDYILCKGGVTPPLHTISLPNLRQKIIVKKTIHIVIGFPIPIGAGKRIIYIGRP